ncbi:putative proton-dependent oligopeptide transporter family [Heracleum sosnowskyi]|uniref:Proton-dependent oligopeptide transporter family n=1 Tax=Heracleum sosnowskyi TaxID=360622 RepID=A0AAD8JBE9_9APIA|nr:putative proton-dependent oligopeptide transporter family [Heracleum sosnowskyi]
MTFFERIAGWVNLLEASIMWVMQTYLTTVWGLSVSHAAGIINVWNGLTFFLPIPFAFFADSFFGNFYMLMFSCFVDAIGLGFLTLSTRQSLGSESIGGTQKALFYIALVLIAAGLASRSVSQVQFFKEQEEETTHSNKEEGICDCGLGQKLTCCVMTIVIIICSLVLPFIQSWSVRFGIPAICSLLLLLIFLIGQFCHSSQRKGPQGSPLTTILRVFVAAISKKSEKLPEDHNTESFYQSDDHVELTHWFRFLNKAARILPTASIEEQKKNKWHLCSVKEVEDTKVCLRMTPLCITLVLCGLVLSLGNTYFLEQANHLNQTLGRLKVNSLIFFFFSFGANIITSNIYRIAKTCTLERYRKYFPVFGIAYALINSVLCCIIAAKVESRRLVNKDKSMSMFWLVPQYILLGVFTGISSICYEELFKTRYPSSMSKYVRYFTLGLTGIGTAGSYLLVYIVGKVSGRGKNPSWFKQSLNESQVDKYYWTLAVISSLNLFLYIIVVRILPHPKPKRANTIQKVKNFVHECAHDCVRECAKCACKCLCCGCCCC